MYRYMHKTRKACKATTMQRVSSHDQVNKDRNIHEHKTCRELEHEIHQLKRHNSKTQTSHKGYNRQTKSRQTHKQPKGQKPTELEDEM